MLKGCIVHEKACIGSKRELRKDGEKMHKIRKSNKDTIKFQVVGISPPAFDSPKFDNN